MSALIRPHAFFLVAAANAPLQLPVTQLNTTVPRGAFLRLDYIVVSYPVTVVANAQTSPNLTFRLANTKGIMHNDSFIPFRDVTTPSSGNRVRASWGLGIIWEPGAVITLEVGGMVAGPIPSTISVTYICQKGWGRR